MGTPVELYVYDLSNGLAATMGPMLIGRPLEGIWHTSVVVFGQEIFFGQGISVVSPPGTTHHGTPRKKLSMGSTQLDRATVQEYIAGLRDTYTADKYHLLDFNCNTFTNEVVGFLTGGKIPDEISGLPALILSTPFGQQMRPMIDQMFRGRNTPSAQDAVQNILPGVAAQAQAGGAFSQQQSTNGPAHKAKASSHAHAQLSAPELEKLSHSLAPVTYPAFPPLPSLSGKLAGFLSAAPDLAPTTKDVLTKRVIAYLATLSAPPAKPTSPLPQDLVSSWIAATNDALAHLPPAEWFPVVDLWRLALARDGARLGKVPSVPAFLSSLVGQLASQKDSFDKPLALTAVKLISNALAVPELVTSLLMPVGGGRQQVAQVTIRALLDADEAVRSAGAGLGWSAVGRVWSARIEGVEEHSDEEWEVEVASAVVEAIGREQTSVEVVHRLVATLGLLLFHSPHYDAVQGLLSVLDAAEVLKGKKEMVKGKVDVVKLVDEVVVLVENA